MKSALKRNLLGLTKKELEEAAAEWGEPAYRGRQLFTWMYGKRASAFDAMSDLGKEFRQRLGESAELRGVTRLDDRTSRRDGTIKFLFGLADGLQVESVLIPPASAFLGREASGEDEQKRLTVCVSTQVGCPLDCAFCATGTMGFRRNLSAGEIVGQVLEIMRSTRRKITNVVFMGMGEPLLNYEAVMAAVEILSTGMNIAARRITVSTAGRADRIRRMGDEQQRCKLAVSLHSAVDETRSRLMPINRNFGLGELLKAIEYYYRRTRQRVTYEVIFFDGVNDAGPDVEKLIAFARRVPSKLNVIPYHSIAFTAPSGVAGTLRPSPRQDEIVKHLRGADLTVMVRSSAGEDIDAACGQLAVRARGNIQNHQTTTPHATSVVRSAGSGEGNASQASC